MENTTKKIYEYLQQHGRMSGRDICDDLGVSEIDVHWAHRDRAIRGVPPIHGGGGSWYAVDDEYVC